MSDLSPAQHLQQLGDDLRLLTQLIADEDAEQANLAMQAHDQRLRSYLALPHSLIDVASLEQIQVRHAELLQQMELARDQAAERLRNQRTTRSAVSAYQTSRNY